MIYIAETLGKDFSFIRVDLYSVDGRVYFGEFCNFPQGGLTAIGHEIDRYLSSFVPRMWDMSIQRTSVKSFIEKNMNAMLRWPSGDAHLDDAERYAEGLRRAGMPEGWLQPPEG